MLEAFIIWQLASVRSGQRREFNPPGQGTYEFMVLLVFAFTLMFWVVPLGIRLGIYKKYGVAAFSLYCFFALLLGLIFFPLYFFGGIAYVIYELSSKPWIERELQKDQEESEVMYEVRYVTPSPNRKES